MQSSSALIIALLSLAAPPVLRVQESGNAAVSRCEQETLARPGFGASYKGKVRNDDYGFSATIPDGYVGWGAAPNAPFHGFSIFINPRKKAGSCIVFRIALHLDLDGDELPPDRKELKPITVGDRAATRTSSVGSAGGMIYENVHVGLRVPHKKDDLHDIEIVLVTPKSDALRNRAVLDRFIASFRFF